MSHQGGAQWGGKGIEVGVSPVQKFHQVFIQILKN